MEAPVFQNSFGSRPYNQKKGAGGLGKPWTNPLIFLTLSQRASQESFTDFQFFNAEK